nr:MAG TPA: hemolysin [Caudoviricetes sp.]
MEVNYVTQKECETRRENIKKDYDELAERVRKSELNDTKFDERIKTLFNVLKFLSGIVSAVVVAEIISFLSKVI